MKRAVKVWVVDTKTSQEYWKVYQGVTTEEAVERFLKEHPKYARELLYAMKV